MQQTSTLVLTPISETENKLQAENLADDFSPADHVINNILNYSKSLEVKKSKSIGFIEVVGS
ncbi:MAG: hypothetical protein JST26_19185 [Bacteroidetes bacterium]|nr:hypothetical protein [Bacteroidota bacterium]